MSSLLGKRRDYVNKLYLRIASPTEPISPLQTVQCVNALVALLAASSPSDVGDDSTQTIHHVFSILAQLAKRHPAALVLPDPLYPSVCEAMAPFLASPSPPIAAHCRRALGDVVAVVAARCPRHRQDIAVFVVERWMDGHLSRALAHLSLLATHTTTLTIAAELFSLIMTRWTAAFSQHHYRFRLQSALRRLWFALAHYEANCVPTAPSQGPFPAPYGVLDAARLAVLRANVQAALHQDDTDGIVAGATMCRDLIASGVSSGLVQLRGTVCWCVLSIAAASVRLGQPELLAVFVPVTTSDPEFAKALAMVKWARGGPSTNTRFDHSQVEQAHQDLVAVLQPTSAAIVEAILESPGTVVQDRSSTVDNTLLESWLSRTPHPKPSALGTFACLYSGDLSLTTGLCSGCSGLRTPRDTPSAIASVCQHLRTFIPSEDPDVQAHLLIALHRVWSSYPPPRASADNPLFAHAVRLLELPHRRLRLLAARIIPLGFTVDRPGSDTTTDLLAVTAMMQRLPYSQQPQLAEACAEVWGGLAIVLDGEQLLLCLCSLVTMMGSANGFHQLLAFAQLQSVATNKHRTPYQLLLPFWPVILYMVVQALNDGSSRLLELVCALVLVLAKAILHRTAPYTLPFALTMYKRDLVLEIAAACGKTKYELVWELRDRCVARLLVDWETIDEDKIMMILANACPETRSHELVDLLIPTATAWEVLKFAQDMPTRIKPCLVFLARRFVGEDVHKDDEAAVLSSFFTTNVLGIVQNFSEVINDTKGSQPLVEKARAVTAILFMVQLCGGAILLALPQISTCLQASMAVQTLVLRTLECWHRLVLCILDTDLLLLVHIVIAVVLTQWLRFDSDTKNEASQVLDAVFSRELLVRKGFMGYVFTLSNYPDLVEIVLRRKLLLRSGSSPALVAYDLLDGITTRLGDNNRLVVVLAVTDLENYLVHYQSEFQGTYLHKKPFHRLVPVLVSTLLEASVRFRTTQPADQAVELAELLSQPASYATRTAQPAVSISTACARCLSLIGTLDPTVFVPPEGGDKTQPVVVVDDFNDLSEVVLFLIRFINDVLARRFWAAVDPHTQLFLAYAMQEYLKRMHLHPDQVEEKGTTDNKIWRKFDRPLQLILTPLLSSRYTVKKSAHQLAVYPLFKRDVKYAVWMREFTLDLLRRSSEGVMDGSQGTGASAPFILFVCSFLVKDQDLTVARYILPYAFLHMVVAGRDEVVESLREELVGVLSVDLSSVAHHSDGDNLRQCLDLVFHIIDYCNKWVAETNRPSKRPRTIQKPQVERVVRLLASIPKDMLARRASECGAYERAIMYLEQSYTERTASPVPDVVTIDSDDEQDSQSSTQFLVHTLEQAYAAIDDVDALAGVVTAFAGQSLDDALLQFQYNDDWVMAQELHEVLATAGAPQQRHEHLTRLYELLNKHALWDRTLSRLHPDASLPRDWVRYGLDAVVFAGTVPQLQQWIARADALHPLKDIPLMVLYRMARALTALAAGKTATVDEEVAQVFSLAGQGLQRTHTHQANQPLLRTLHIALDVRLIAHLLGALLATTLTTLQARLENTGDDFSTTWEILLAHRAAMSLAGVADSGDTSLRLAQISRQHGRLDLATRLLMGAVMALHPKRDWEHAEMLWAQGHHTRALKMLEGLRQRPNLDLRDAALLHLQYARWLDALLSSSTAVVLKEFAAAIELDPVYDASYFYLAKYCNKVVDLTAALNEKRSKEDLYGDYELRVVHNYGRAVLCGPGHLYEALPKLLTVWLDFSANTTHVPLSLDRHNLEIKEARKANAAKMLADVRAVLQRVPAYYWYTVLSQVLLRITHPVKDTSELLLDIAATVTLSYPKHALWHVLAQDSSADKERKRRGRDILSRIKVPAELVQHARVLFDSIFRIADTAMAAKTRRCLLQADTNFQHPQELYGLLVAPLKHNFTITLPATPGAAKNHTPFPHLASTTFDKFDDRADVIGLLQRPKRIFFLGSDGRTHSLLCKKDDVRKDLKFMDMTVVLNRMLAMNHECVSRGLHIETYVVVPLNENHGVIEWVEHVKPMRSIVMEKLRARGQDYDLSRNARLLDAKQPAEERRRAFGQLLARFPPVLPLWFLQQFPDPVAWYRARLLYTRLCAVMLMVGYVMGIGDRHGENLLFRHTGALMHVDFDCIFEKGLALAVPEVVPFRLTSNMVAAFGVSGVEGPFRRLCELTMLLVRENESTVMNQLESFVYDPIMDWTRKGRNHNTPDRAMKTIQAKIRGIVDEGLPMGVQGQVEHLITTATGLEELASMYHGWMAYM